GVVSFVSNPFETIFPVPVDGRGLNPLLEDANMMTHPPLLYTGVVGLTVPYASAMAALIKGKLDEAWIVTTRRWTITAWFFLTMGNLVGAWCLIMSWVGAVTGPGTRWKTPRLCLGCRRPRFSTPYKCKSAVACSRFGTSR